MSYHHQWLQGLPIPLSCSKIVCVGRNYVAHAHELGNAVPDEPLLFIKPETALVPLAPAFPIPTDRGEVHHEAEIAVLIGLPLCRADEAQAAAAILGVGAALDLTLRERQAELKEKRQPWEKAKAFDNSCPVSAFVPTAQFPDLAAIPLCLTVNGQVRQQGHSGQMIWSIPALVADISHHFSLRPGDLVLTGTPAGVGPLQAGDALHFSLGTALTVDSRVLAG